jgi:hypothetical protein
VDDPDERAHRWRARLRKRKTPLVLTFGIAIGAAVGSTWLGEASSRAFDALWDAAFGEHADLEAVVESGDPYDPLTDDTAVVPASSIRDLPPLRTIRHGFGLSRTPCPTHKWVNEAGGVDTAAVFVIYIEGRTDRTVRLNGVDVEVIRSKPPIEGFEVGDCFPALRLPFRHLEVDLQARTVRLLRPVKFRRRLPGGGLYPRGRLQREPFAFTLGRGEIEAFAVVIRSGRCSCSWRLRFRYIVDGETKSLIVDNDGEPFETTDTSRARRARWDRRTQSWRIVVPPRAPPEKPGSDDTKSSAP